MNAESDRMTKILRRLAWQRIEKESKKVKKSKRQRQSGQLLDLVVKTGRLLRKLWELSGRHDGLPLLFVLLILFCVYLMTLAT